MDALFPTIFSGMIVLSVALLVIGVVKPKWIHFWQQRPGRLTIIAIALTLLVVGLSEAGEMRPAGMNDAETVQPANVLSGAAYLVSNATRQCEPGTKSGRAGVSDDEKTAAGIRYMVKTPAHYDATVAHPLVMVYAPARTNRYQSEDFVHLTQEATAAGFIVAYADHRTMSPKSIGELAAIPGLIEQKWCVDHTRIVLTGHSDGGTTAMATERQSIERDSLVQRRRVAGECRPGQVQMLGHERAAADPQKPPALSPCAFVPGPTGQIRACGVGGGQPGWSLRVERP